MNRGGAASRAGFGFARAVERHFRFLEELGYEGYVPLSVPA